jgi:hypothetical protein
MSEFIGWMIVLGLAIAIVGIFVVSTQIDKHTRNAIGIMIHSNEMILARLEQLANSSVRAPTPPAVGIALERRRAQRRNPLTQMFATAGEIERRGFPHRRVDDLLLS